jgi:integrase
MRITQQQIRRLNPPEKGNKVTYDDEVTGFGVRITAAGAISFVLRYVVDRQERRLTIGKYPDLSASAAREEAISLRGMVSKGVDPLERRHERERAPTMRELAEYYLSGHATTKRPKSVKDDRAMLDGHILPRLGNRKVAAVSSHDIIRLRNSLEDRPYRANRVLSLLGKMFSIAMKQRWREDNPARDVGRFPEEKRDRWLSIGELSRLTETLDQNPNQNAANAIRLLILTGARRSEVLSATWDQFDFERGVWTKPSAHTKQKRTEHVPLSAAALSLLSQMYETTGEGGYLFPGNKPASHLVEIKRFWSSVCRTADIENARLHDLRHTFASHLVSSGHSLVLVGRLLGHTQPQTTQRYSHIADDPLREAVNRFGEMLTGAQEPAAGRVVPIRSR